MKGSCLLISLTLKGRNKRKRLHYYILFYTCIALKRRFNYKINPFIFAIEEIGNYMPKSFESFL